MSIDTPFIVNIPPTEKTSLLSKRQPHPDPLPRIRLIDFLKKHIPAYECIILISSFLRKKTVIPMALTGDDQFHRNRCVIESAQRIWRLNIVRAEESVLLIDKKGKTEDAAALQKKLQEELAKFEAKRESNIAIRAEAVDQDFLIQSKLISRSVALSAQYACFRQEMRERESLRQEEPKAFRAIGELGAIHKIFKEIQQILRKAEMAEMIEHFAVDESSYDQIAMELFTILDRELSALPDLKKRLNTAVMKDHVQAIAQQVSARAIIRDLIDALFIYIRIRENGVCSAADEEDIDDHVQKLGARGLSAFAARFSSPTQPLEFTEGSLLTHYKALFGYAQQYENRPEQLRLLFAMMNDAGRKIISMGPGTPRFYNMLKLIDANTLRIMKSLATTLREQPDLARDEEAAPLIRRAQKLPLVCVLDSPVSVPGLVLAILISLAAMIYTFLMCTKSSSAVENLSTAACRGAVTITTLCGGITVAALYALSVVHTRRRQLQLSW